MAETLNNYVLQLFLNYFIINSCTGFTWTEKSCELFAIYHTSYIVVSQHPIPNNRSFVRAKLFNNI